MKFISKIFLCLLLTSILSHAAAWAQSTAQITGTVKDHPQFGVEVILEDPKQIKVID